MVSRIGRRPKRSSSSTGAVVGRASSRELRSLKPPFVGASCAFLASARLRAIASLMLSGGFVSTSGSGGPPRCLVGVKERILGSALALAEGVLGVPIRVLDGVEGGFNGERVDRGGMRDIVGNSNEAVPETRRKLLFPLRQSPSISPARRALNLELEPQPHSSTFSKRRFCFLLSDCVCSQEDKATLFLSSPRAAWA